jgi:hypothetical protein
MQRAHIKFLAMGLRVTSSCGTIGQACLSVAALMGLGATLVGCQVGPSASTPAAIPTGDGVVAGGINYCVGAVPPTGAKNPGLVAGTVTVLQGKVSDVPKAGGVKYVLPTHRVASETPTRAAATSGWGCQWSSAVAR